MDSQYIEDIFSHHPPKELLTITLHENVRSITKHAAIWMNEKLPESPEKAIAIRHLQQAMMFANAAIAIYQEQ